MDRLNVYCIISFILLICDYGYTELIQENFDLCSKKLKCGECIQLQGCVWCAEMGFQNSRCFNESLPTSCTEKYNPKEISNVFIDKTKLMNPNTITIKCRLNEPCQFNITFTQSKNHLVDLYYLMDLSNSMEDDKDNLASLSDKLIVALKTLTNDFSVGFGSFVDKVMMPYTYPISLSKTCENCKSSYGYRHQMKLSNSSRDFQEQVKSANVFGNLDPMEGGFDALIQATVCKEKIGWRSDSRRFILFATDDYSHYAGDGKLGGIIIPNDGKCHLNEKGEYDFSTIQDYPSVSQINYVLKENFINLIFAVTADKLEEYKRISENIEGSSTAQLSTDSSNIVELLENEIRKKVATVELKDDSQDYFTIKYFSNCSSGPFIERNKCEEIKAGSKVEFQVEILIPSCPANIKHWKQDFTIYPVGLKESTEVYLEILCKCPCEDNTEINSKCNGHGIDKCGECECNSDKYGDFCECIKNSSSEVIPDCREKTTNLICSGKGKCTCGKCNCDNKDITGEFCECDKRLCMEDEKECSNHGTCDCNKCNCNEGWSGSKCECIESNENCINNNITKKICSGYGECVCGECKCKTTSEGPYHGKFCEKSPTPCDMYKDCVQYFAYKMGSIKNNEDFEKECTGLDILKVPSIGNFFEYKFPCPSKDEENCVFKFAISEDDKIHVEEHRICPAPNTLFIMCLIIGIIVFVGIILILTWKGVTYYYDRREYLRFEKERANAKWSELDNPLYREPHTEFRNPTYRRED